MGNLHPPGRQETSGGLPQISVEEGKGAAPVREHWEKARHGLASSRWPSAPPVAAGMSGGGWFMLTSPLRLSWVDVAPKWNRGWGVRAP